MHRIVLVLLLVASVLVTGCMGFNPVVDTVLNQAAPEKKAYSNGFEYLEVRVAGRSTSMALGSRYSLGGQLHEHWYSGQREMLHLVNGRINEVVGMTYEVRRTAYEPPSWDVLMQSEKPMIWSQAKDMMPGYRYGVVEFVVSQRVMPTKAEAEVVGPGMVWIEERVDSKRASGAEWVYRQKFALAAEGVVYSVQCIAPDLCFELKPLGMVLK